MYIDDHCWYSATYVGTHLRWGSDKLCQKLPLQKRLKVGSFPTERKEHKDMSNGWGPWFAEEALRNI